MLGYVRLSNMRRERVRLLSFETHLVENSKVTRDLLLLTAIFTSGDIYCFLTSACWRASLPGERFVLQLAREILPGFISARLKSGMNKIARRLIQHVVVNVEMKSEWDAYSRYIQYIQCLEFVFRNYLKRNAGERVVDDSGRKRESVFDIISRICVRSRIRDSLARNFIHVH